jgi:hypothetical protein
VRELEHLSRHRPLDAVHARDPVANRDDAANLGDVHIRRVGANLVADDLGDFLSLYLHASLFSP